MEYEVLQPGRIGQAIVRLISEAEEYVYVVSPFLSTWQDLRWEVKKAHSRKVNFSVFVRQLSETELKEGRIAPKQYALEQLNLKATEIKGLHAKLYLSEKACIVTSMNLSDRSEAQSFDFGIYSESKEFVQDTLTWIETNILLPNKVPAVQDKELVRAILLEAKERGVKLGYEPTMASNLDFGHQQRQIRFQVRTYKEGRLIYLQTPICLSEREKIAEGNKRLKVPSEIYLSRPMDPKYFHYAQLSKVQVIPFGPGKYDWLKSLSQDAMDLLDYFLNEILDDPNYPERFSDWV